MNLMNLPPKPMESPDCYTDDNLVTEILLKLPLRDILKAKILEKRLNRLISTPTFRRMHTSTAKIVATGVYAVDAGHRPVPIRVESAVPAIDFIEDEYLIRFLDECNGLILCKRQRGKSFDVIIGNPTLKTFRLIELPENNPPLTPNHIFALAFEPSLSPTYRILAINNSEPYSHYVYRSSDLSWTTSSLFPRSRIRELYSPLFCDQKVYWLSRNGVVSLGFDFIDKGLDLEVPQQFHNQMQVVRFLGKSRDFLYLVLVGADESQHILINQKDGEGWTQMYEVVRSDFTHGVSKLDGHGFQLFSILAIFKGVTEAEDKMVVWIPGYILSYNFRLKTSSILSRENGFPIRGFSFNPSLADV